MLFHMAFSGSKKVIALPSCEMWAAAHNTHLQKALLNALPCQHGLSGRFGGCRTLLLPAPSERKKVQGRSEGHRVASPAASGWTQHSQRSPESLKSPHPACSMPQKEPHCSAFNGSCSMQTDHNQSNTWNVQPTRGHVRGHQDSWQGPVAQNSCLHFRPSCLFGPFAASPSSHLGF